MTKKIPQKNQRSSMLVACNISLADHKKVKRLAVCYGTSMREILTEIIHNGLENDTIVPSRCGQECNTTNASHFG